MEHPFFGKTVLVATKHGKEAVLAPLFEQLGMKCLAAPLDTDIFGTFSGEIERQGTVRETLRKKISACQQLYPDAEFILASEGSFGPHPLIGFIPTDLESLLFYQVDTQIEIQAEYLDTQPVHEQKVLLPGDDFKSYLQKIGFPEQAVMVHPEMAKIPVFKGINDKDVLRQALFDVSRKSSTGKVMICTDVRACCSPRRRVAIGEAGKKLIEKLTSFCPQCHFPGFAISRGVPGMVCGECGEATQAP